MKSVKNKIRNTLSVFLGLPQIIKSVSDISDRYSRMEKTWQMATTEIQDIGFRGNTKIIIASNLGKSFCKVYDLAASLPPPWREQWPPEPPHAKAAPLQS